MSLKNTINTLTFPNVILVTKSSCDYILKYLFRTEDLQIFATAQRLIARLLGGRDFYTLK